MSEMIGGYTLGEMIGHGGMGAVHESTGPDGNRVAVKVLYDQFNYQEEYVKRLLHELELARKLSHPNVVKVLDFGEDNGKHYIVMEYVEGKPLDELMKGHGMASVILKRSSKVNTDDGITGAPAGNSLPAQDVDSEAKPFPTGDVSRIMKQVAGVLQAAGDIGLVHRDINPNNILIDQKGNVKLLDVGLAKDKEALAGVLGMTGQSIGTPPYMSPEQHKGFKDIDSRSDLYALGTIGYHLLTGRAPFLGPTTYTFAMQHIHEIPESACKVNAEVPLNLSQVIDRLLAKSPDDRHQDPAELIEDLNRVEGGEVPLKLYKAKKSKKHNLLNTVLTTVAAVLICVGALGGYLYYNVFGEQKKMIQITIPDLNLVLVPIKPGSFMMGANSGQSYDEPIHKVRLTKPFWMGRTEVTQAQYKAIMGKSPSRFRGDNNPVEQVSWFDCLEFCKKLTERERRAGRLPANQEYRLPTEAEWEYCCRAGSTRKYSFGDSERLLKDYAWYSSNAGSKTHPVAQKKSNAWGLYDMHGNVMELCIDRYGSYSGSAQVNPTGSASGTFRVSRGGSWGLLAWRSKSADRGKSWPSFRDLHVGFRLVRSPVVAR